MKIVLLNAATLPVYREALAALRLDAKHHNLTTGYRPAGNTVLKPQAEDAFHIFRDRIARSQLLLWIARDEQGVTGCVQLNLTQGSGCKGRADIEQLLVHSRSRRRGTGRQLIRALESKAWDCRQELICLDLLPGSAAEAFCQAQGYQSLAALSNSHLWSQGQKQTGVTYYKRLVTVAFPNPGSTY